jgi:hypothetical protein
LYIKQQKDKNHDFFSKFFMGKDRNEPIASSNNLKFRGSGYKWFRGVCVSHAASWTTIFKTSSASDQVWLKSVIYEKLLTLRQKKLRKIGRKSWWEWSPFSVLSSGSLWYYVCVELWIILLLSSIINATRTRP